MTQLRPRPGRMCRRRIAVRSLLALGALCLLAGSAAAMEIATESGSGDKAITLRLSGAFAQGDGLKVRAFIAKLPPDAPITANLDLSGGSFSEAMSVGRFLHQLGVTTVVPAKAKCMSPCPLVFFAGADVNGESARIKHTTARVGFSPFLPAAKEGKYTWKDLETVAAETQQSILTVLDYLYDIGANPDVLGRFYEDIPDRQVRYISDDDLLTLGVSVFDDASGQLIDARVLQRRMRR